MNWGAAGTVVLVALCAAAVAFWLGCIVTSVRRIQPGQSAGRRLRLLRTVRTISIVLFALIFAGAICIYVESLPLDKTTISQLIAVGLLSGAVGYGELVSRYRDDPGRLLTADPTAIYVCVNVAAGIAALALVREFNVFATLPQADHKALYETLLAGFGAIAFFRSSLFTARVGGTDIGVGPATLLKSLLDASDMMINRDQAGGRADEVTLIMPGVDFEKAKISLPALCFTLVEGVTQDQQTTVGEQIRKLSDNQQIDAPSKTIILGVYLIREVGADVLARAVGTLGDRIKAPQVAGSP